MKCLFCEVNMTEDGADLIVDETTKRHCIMYSCYEKECMVNNDFPRYRCSAFEDDKIIQQEYAIGTIYVKVNRRGTYIYKLISAALEDELHIKRSLWLNSTNFQATLDTLKMCVIFS